MSEQRMIIEQTAEGEISVVHDGVSQTMSTLEEALHAIKETFTASQGQRVSAVRETKQPAKEDQDWIRALCGKYRDVLTPTEQYFREKQEEIELEARRLDKRRS
ncbi:MAG: histidine kinase [Candidatus Poribacteria bacterium]|nr:histidine kinase [Candidatus Poribacteria bacterium]